jgi:hypothetical protein
MPQPNIIASTDAGIVFPDRLPPRAILQKFVEAMNVHRQHIGYGHLKLKYTTNKGNDRYIVFDSPQLNTILITAAVTSVDHTYSTEHSPLDSEF